jgi:hypothetical protein
MVLSVEEGPQELPLATSPRLLQLQMLCPHFAKEAQQPTKSGLSLHMLSNSTSFGSKSLQRCPQLQLTYGLQRLNRFKAARRTLFALASCVREAPRLGLFLTHEGSALHSRALGWGSTW